jgi:prepilin-type N-terminal cleavage/methylation domain-containing protein
MDSDTRKSRAFSLLELLIVIAILAMLSSVTVAGFNSIVASSRMDLAGRIVVDEIALARQMAVSRNENVLLRFQKQPR